MKRLSADGDPLEEPGRIIDFEGFRLTPVVALAYGDGTKGVVCLCSCGDAQGTDPGSAAQCERRAEGVSDPGSAELAALPGFGLGAPTPDANTIRLFREKLTEAIALEVLFADFDRQLCERGQIVDAALAAAPKQRNTEAEKDAIKADEIRPDEPAPAAQKDTDARWTLKFSQSQVHGRRQARHRYYNPQLRLQEQHLDPPGLRLHPQRQGHRCTPLRRARRLRDVVTSDRTASEASADTAYHSQANE